MQCRNALTRIDALRTRELPPLDRVAVEQHLRTCRTCDGSRTDVEELAQAVKAAVLSDDAAPWSCREAVTQEVARSRRRSSDQ
jgi:predicted anti-sigma-YlaC factor YlaD